MKTQSNVFLHKHTHKLMIKLLGDHGQLVGIAIPAENLDGDSFDTAHEAAERVFHSIEYAHTDTHSIIRSELAWDRQENITAESLNGGQAPTPDALTPA